MSRPHRLRDHLALALDVDDLVEALRLARELQPWFGVAKVGLELFSAAGPEPSAPLRSARLRGLPRPQAARHPDHRRAGGRGCSARSGARTSRCTPPAASAMLRGRRRGLRARAPPRPGSPAPVALAVTVLTSDADAGRTSSPSASPWPSRPGCGGIVCAAADVARGPRWRPAAARPWCPASGPPASPPTTRPGRPRPAPPSPPAPTSSSIGRAVTAAADPAAAAAAAAEVAAEVAAARVPGHDPAVSMPRSAGGPR